MRVIAPFDSAQGAMTLIALATAIFVIQLDSWQLENFYFYELKKTQNFGYFLDFS